MPSMSHPREPMNPRENALREGAVRDPFMKDYLRVFEQKRDMDFFFPWKRYSGEFDDPLWEDLQNKIRCDILKARLLTYKAIEEDISDPFWKEWENKTHHDDVKNKRSNHRFASLVKSGKQRGGEVFNRVQSYVRTAEFWLGVAFGATTRITTKMAILMAFPDRPELATVASFTACAVAGVTAGMITHLVRTMVRNVKAPRGQEKEKYFGKALLESAIVGLFGGIFGGYATNAGTVIARSGSFALGASVGIAAGVFHAGYRSYKTQRKTGWNKLAFEGAIYGALGGVLGIISSDLIGSHASIAAPIPTGEAGSALMLPPNPHSFQEYCNPCGPPPPPPPVVVPVQVPPPPQEIHIYLEEHHAAAQHVQQQHVTPKHHVTHKPVKHVHHETKPAKPVQAEHQEVKHKHYPSKKTAEPCEKKPKVKHAAKTKHPVKHHVKPHKVVKHLPPKTRVIEKVIVIEQPPPPPRVYVAPPPPPPVNPCDTGYCADPCHTTSMIDLKGPCADPRTPCVTRVSFNEDGIATKAVLEPRSANITGTYYEINTPHGTSITRFSDAAERAVQTAENPSETKLSLIVPIANNTTLALANPMLTPA